MISAVVNTLNEEKNLPHALASVKAIADEIVVVDMHSTDKTVEIAKGYGAKVYDHPQTGYVEPARNFAIDKALGEWILLMDADEEIPPTLAEAIKKAVKNPKADFYRLPRKNIIFGKWIKNSRWWPDYNVRLFKKGSVSWSELIHAVPVTQGTGENFPEKEETAIIHYHYGSIDQFVERMNRYSSLHAELKVKDGYKFSWKDLIMKPSGEFLSRYFFGNGYKDGLHGLALASLQAFSELIMYLKVWQKEGFTDKEVTAREVISLMKDEEKDLHYWWADTLVKDGAGLGERIKRKFRLP